MTQPVSAALARKLTAGQEGRGDRPHSVLRALRLALARAAADRLRLPLAVIAAKQVAGSPDTLGGQIGDDWLLLQFTGAEGLQAAVCMDMGTVSAIVQVQTVGEVMPSPPVERAFTDTDAAMVAPWVEEVFRRTANLVEEAGDQERLAGYQYRLRLADLRTLSLALVEDAYVSYDLTVELGNGLRQGKVSVLLPELSSGSDAEDHDEDAALKLGQGAGVLRAELDTVICRMSVPLASLSALATGDILPLAGARLDQAEVLTIDRSRAAVGRLGQCGGMRAVRLNEQVPLPSPLGTDAQEFLAARAHNQPAADISADAAEIVLNEASGLVDDLELGDSDQIAAEISKLAGLSDDAGQLS